MGTRDGELKVSMCADKCGSLILTSKKEYCCCAHSILYNYAVLGQHTVWLERLHQSPTRDNPTLPFTFQQAGRWRLRFAFYLPQR